MKKQILIAVVAVLVLAVPAWCANDASAGFNALKSLAGEWEGRASGQADGQTQTTTWKMVSGGSAMMEAMSHDSMISMYHLDNGRLLMTHYCSARNQPRMAAEVSADGKTFTFNFVDGTNISTKVGYMKKMVLVMKDKDHISETWTYTQDGKENVESFELTRK